MCVYINFRRCLSNTSLGIVNHAGICGRKSRRVAIASHDNVESRFARYSAIGYLNARALLLHPLSPTPLLPHHPHPAPVPSCFSGNESNRISSQLFIGEINNTDWLAAGPLCVLTLGPATVDPSGTSSSVAGRLTRQSHWSTAAQIAGSGDRTRTDGCWFGEVQQSVKIRRMKTKKWLAIAESW